MTLLRLRDRHQLTPFSRLEVFLGSDEDVCTRVERQQLGRKLAEHVIRNDEHRLARQAEPLQFHASGHHRERLSSADPVCEQCVWRLQNAPDPGFLMWPQSNGRACAGQSQVIAVERPQADTVKRVVVFAD